MKRKAKASNSNPSVVLKAFAPETEYTLTLDGWLLLEALQSGYTTGANPTMRDTILALLVMTDEEAVLKARKAGKIDQLISAFSEGKRPGDVLALGPKIKEAFEAALEPASSGADPSEKKSSQESDGG
jgi:hypothetical protein